MKSRTQVKNITNTTSSPAKTHPMPIIPPDWPTGVNAALLSVKGGRGRGAATTTKGGVGEGGCEKEGRKSLCIEVHTPHTD